MNTPITRRSLYSWVLGRNLKLQLVLLAVILLTVALRVFPLEMQKRVVNTAIALKDHEALLLYCGLYIVAVVLAGALKYGLNVLQSYVGERTLLEIRARLFEHVLSLPLSFFRRTSPGHVTSALVQELAPVGDFIGTAVAVPVVNVLTFLAMAGYMVHLNPLLALISVCIYPVDMLVLPLLQRRFNLVNRRRIRRMRDMMAVTGESVAGIQEVHANAAIPVEGAKFGEHLRGLFATNMRWATLKYGIKFTNNFFQSLGPFTLFLLGGWLAIRGRFDLGALVAFLSAYEKLYDPWKELIDFYQTFQDSRVRYTQVMETFDQEPEHALTPRGREALVLDGSLAVRDVSFAVAGGIRLLDGVNLDLRPGEHLALVGFSGSGKSTLAMVVAQLYGASRGRVLLGGRDVAGLTKFDVAANVGVVNQHPYIFSGTLRENLLYSCRALRLGGGACKGADGEPDLDALILAVQQVGLFVDVLRFGLAAVLDPERDAELMRRAVEARARFQSSRREELAGDVEFFAPGAFLEYSSVAANILAAQPLRDDFRTSGLPGNRFFLDFLDREGLTPALLALGRDVTLRAVDVLRSMGGREELFADSPIPREEFEAYAALALRLERAGGDWPASLGEADGRLLLRLALEYVPGESRLSSVSSDLRGRILAARPRLMEAVRRERPGAVAFHGEADYNASRSLLDNILHGRIKSDSAGAQDRVEQLVMQLLIEESMLEEVVARGLEFDVGSQGDRLSGGQRQKVALARAFLKEPPVLILDEATSALDNASQSRIQNLLAMRFRGRSTVVSVVHRLDTLPGYDRVAVLRAGRVVEQGTYDALMANKGALYDLVHG